MLILIFDLISKKIKIFKVFNFLLDMRNKFKNTSIKNRRSTKNRTSNCSISCSIWQIIDRSHDKRQKWFVRIRNTVIERKELTKNFHKIFFLNKNCHFLHNSFLSTRCFQKKNRVNFANDPFFKEINRFHVFRSSKCFWNGKFRI